MADEPAPGTPPVDPGTPPADPGTPPADPGTPPADPGTPPADPGTPPADPPADPPPGELQDFSMPEGVTLNPALTESLKTLAAENGWDQTTAQKVANLGAQMAQQQAAAVDAMRNQWTADARADTEIGGENFDANVAKANAVIDAVADKEFVDFLASTGLSNHPSMIKTFTRLHAAIGEDTLVNGMPKPGQGPKTPEAVMFPDMNQA